jgi:hypothetical protein
MNYIWLIPATYFERKVHKMDVKNVFIHTDLIEYIYMKQPFEFEKDRSFVSIKET